VYLWPVKPNDESAVSSGDESTDIEEVDEPT
jgi:hypothetical protein